MIEFVRRLVTGVLAASDAARTANERVAGLVAWCRELRPAEKPLVAKEW